MKPFKPTLLIIDDDDSIRQLLAFVLRKQYEVVTCSSGMEGLAWLAHHDPPSVILLDLEMPELSGFEVLNQLKASGWYQHIPVVILSGHESLQIRQSCLRAGAEAYLLKPFHPDQLHHALAQSREAQVA